ncbi:MAG: linear amide C-N hydrolase [Clostridia bacterium]|nr:linear amide C-N hydrolase [Clostridia bacterium]
MKKRICILLALLILTLASCAKDEPSAEPAPDTPTAAEPVPETEAAPEEEEPAPAPDDSEQDLHAVTVSAPANGMEEISKGVYLARVGDCGFSAFLEEGGASSDREVLAFLSGHLSVPGLDFQIPGVGCSTVAVTSPDGGRIFGRNFDWSCREVLLLEAHPDGAYASFSTVNVDFIKESAANLSDAALAAAAYYAPLDGMNEKGLAVSVNMISDSDRIRQRTDLPDLTTTTALRLLLDRAATVEEAIALLGQYDLHGSYDMMIHFAVTDAEGHAVAVEYIQQEMIVTETPVLTNFYVAEGEKHGIGAAQSHERFKVLEAFLADHPTASVYQVRDALTAAGESNFDPDPNERTEWSVIYDQMNLTATWYRRENFSEGWSAALKP